jgi:tight adherence protein C
MELLATFVLFALVVTAAAYLGSRFWLRPRAAIERVTRAAADAPMARHPSLIFRDMIARLGSAVPQSPKDVTLMQRRLIRAGIRSPGALKLLRGTRVLLALALPLVAAAVVVRTQTSTDKKVLAVGAALMAGFTGPTMFVRMRAKRRQKQIRRGLPNSLDLMVVCVESGLGLDQAIMQTAKELEQAHPEICEELALVNLELKAGKRRVEALRNLADRTAVDELKKLVAVLIQADRFGTGIAQSLRGHSDYMRVQARQTAEEKAAKLGVKLIFPIFFCILPSLFVVTVGPMVVKIMRDVLPMMRDM